MAAEPFKPFTDDAAALTIGGMTVENGTDRISLSGSLDLARDRQGLDHAKALRSTLDGVIAVLEAERRLPARATVAKPAVATRKPNPFA
ncbi:hypothetical protein D3273_19840 [Lichenibacterium minor]|uniref:Uncharacterized protein n=1 Tax=Lichenibacterium minor TaxID=2316528 RepID=A0A4Q2U5J7_9HYPH|nr:hypothetical protein [Lichenibacterium minor]RYC30227.1 hypothetical protein D3273_19840 [Lichenibacterium minor]